MDLNKLVSRAKGLATDGVVKARQLASENSGAVTSGLSKAEQFVNEKTGGKYSEQLAKGREGVSSALGVPGDAKQAYDEARAAAEQASGPVTADPVVSEKIDPPEDIEGPKPI